MEKIKKRILSGLFLVILVFLTACNTNEGNDTNNNISSESMKGHLDNKNLTIEDNAESSPKGRFIEEDYVLPSESGSVLAIRKQQDSSLRLLTDKEVYKSADGGGTWVLDENIDLSPYKSEKYYIYSGALDQNGNIYLNMRAFSGLLEFHTVFINKNGEAHSFNLELNEIDGQSKLNFLQSVGFSLNGDIIAFDYVENILIIEAHSGEIKTQIPSDDTKRLSAHSVGDKIVVETTDGIELYDMSGNLLDSDNTITKMYAQSKPADGSSSKFQILPQDDGAGIYFCNTKGLYHYTFGSNLSELLINGSLSSIGSPSNYIAGMVAKDDISFLIIFKDSNSKQIIKNYSYSNEVEAIPSKEIKVYSLYDSEMLRQEINSYNTDNPNSYALLEIGIDENSSMTKSDAIKTLNTRIMAGTGPDVLILDGMPIQSYIDKGLLVDISDIIDEVSETEGTFGNIVNAYENAGMICAVPTRFSIPLIIGDKESVDKITDLNSLTEQIIVLKKQYPDIKSVLGMYDEILLKSLFDISASTWIKVDGTLDEEKLKEFLEAAKMIQDTDGKTREEIEELKEKTPEEGYRSYSVLMGSSKLAISQVGDIETALSEVTSMNSKMEEISYKVADGQAINTFIPSSIIGISTKSKNIDGASSLIKALLSSKTQSFVSYFIEGFPVNRTAFDTICIEPKRDAEEVYKGDGPIDITWPTEEELEPIKNIIDTLTTEAILDSMIKDTVLEEGVNYLLDGVSVEEAVSNIMQKINIYLAE